MKMKNKSLYYLLTILPLIVTLILLPMLPDSIPMHYNFKGEINRWGNRYEILILPILTIIFAFIVPKLKMAKNNEYNAKAIDRISFFTVCFFSVLNYIILYASFHSSHSNPINVISACLCILFIVIGNILPKVKQNSFVGVRLPWTLNDETIWYKTHRLSGTVWVIGGSIMLPLCLFLSSTYSSIVLISGLLIITIIPTVYSYVIYKH